MQTYLTVKVLGVIGAVVGPWGSWSDCTKYLPDFNKQADAAFSDPSKLSDMQKVHPNLKRDDVLYECKESNTKPELGKQ